MKVCSDLEKTGVARIAAHFAPILWFSPDEPLLKGPTGPLARVGHDFAFRVPTTVPGAEASHGPVVYYQISDLKTRGKPKQGNSQPKEVDLRRVEELTLRYFFYYPSDQGLNAHQDDLEVAEFDLVVTSCSSFEAPQYDTAAACRFVRLSRVKSFAHGLDWTANRLRIDGLEDVALPISLLVEEGKHATCPDRNADGLYSPGYDVNELVSEAWGLRDTFGSGIVVPKYRSELTKRRNPANRLFPGGPHVPAVLRQAQSCSSPHGWPASLSPLSTYQLREAAPAARAFEAACPPSGCAKRGHPKLAEMIGRHNFGGGIRQPWLTRFMDFAAEEFSLVLRRDQVTSGNGLRLALLSKISRTPFVSGWLVARGTWDFRSGFSIEPLYSPSASGWVDWYAGPGGFFIDDEHRSFWSKFDFKPEIGLKLRLRRDELGILGKVLKVVFHPNRLGTFVGVRIGLRAESLDRILGQEQANLAGIRGVRFVWEVGGGAW